jgi:uncharacterized protein involved in outer membrane biogenesis
MEVRFERLRPTFFKGSRITGLSASREGGSCLSAKEVFVRPRLLSLVRGQFVMSEIRVEGARLVLVDTPRSQTQAVTDTKTQVSLVKNGKPRLGIRRLILENAAFDWIDAKGKARIQMEGIELNLSNHGVEAGDGILRIARGTFYEVLPFQNLEAPIHISGGIYSCAPVRAISGGGTLEASIEATPRQQDIPFSATAEARDIDLERISQEIPSLRSTGKAQGKITLAGLLKNADTLRGEGVCTLENGILKGLGVLQSIGQVFQISELANLKVKKASAQFSVGNRKILLKELLVDGNDLTLSAPGEIDFEQRLNLNGKLALPEKMLSGKALQAFSDKFSPTDASGFRSIVFQVTGTVDKPKTNLLQKLVGDNLGGVINSLLGGFLKPKRTEPAPPKETQSPDSSTPTPTTPK